MAHAQKVMDKLPVRVERNILYDVGGEIQDILERNYVYKDQGGVIYNRFDKMLKVIIGRVREIEEGSIETTEWFNITNSNNQKGMLSNGMSFQKKLVFESTVKKYIEQSETQSRNDISSFIKIKAPKENIDNNILHTDSSINDIIRNPPRKVKKIFCPSESQNSNSGTLESLEFLKWYKRSKIPFKQSEDKNVTKRNRDIASPPIRDFETDQTISLFGNNQNEDQKGILSPSDPNKFQNCQTWGSGSNPDQTTERVYAMLQMNKNLIEKYNSIRSPEGRQASSQPRRMKPVDLETQNIHPKIPKSPFIKKWASKEPKRGFDLSPIGFEVSQE